MPDWNRSYASFRLNFEQQGKRAKDLLRAARAGEPEALARFLQSPPKLAEAQYLIAKELRLDNWAALKRHIGAMTLAREAMNDSVLDGELRTLHIRCGHDLQKSLPEAGFRGDYFADVYPYLIGPVREGPGCLEQRAHFIVDQYGDSFNPPLEYAGQLRAMEDQELELSESANYERVVLWFEHDRNDQLSLIHLLGHYAVHPKPPQLELIALGDFPGSRRFIGLGELPPEALRLLWTTRRPVTPVQLQLGLSAWRALSNVDPRALASIARSGTPALPLLAPALHRHLRELPSVVNGLSLTEELALSLMAKEPHSLSRIFWSMLWETDPLPGQPDGDVRDRILDMEETSERLFTRSPGRDSEGKARSPWTDVFAVTDLGRAVLRGEVDFRSLNPPPRWVGGVEVTSSNVDWRWDEQRQDAVALRADGHIQ